MLCGYISPVIPRGDTQLARQFINAIDGSASVTTGNNHLFIRHLNDIHLSLALDHFCIKDAIFSHFIDNFATSKGSSHNGGRRSIAKRDFSTTDRLDICAKVLGSTEHSPLLIVGYADGYTVTFIHLEIALVEVNKSVGCTAGRRRQKQDENDKRVNQSHRYKLLITMQS